jgi:hypothetical protein
MRNDGSSMLTEQEHGLLQPGSDPLHSPFFKTYANAAARTGDATLHDTDVRKVALQLDDYSQWVLLGVPGGVPTWQQLSAGGAGGAGTAGTVELEDADLDGNLQTTVAAAGVTAASNIQVTQQAGDSIIAAVATPGTDEFTLTLAAAPGPGNSVTFAFLIH